MGIKDLFSIKRFINKTDDAEQITINGAVVRSIQTDDKSKVHDPIIPFAVPYGYDKRVSMRRDIVMVDHEYDLPTIANALQIDGLLQRIVNIYVENIMKNGYEMTSKNDKAQIYVRRRIKEMEQLTSVKLFETMTTAARQMVSYGNAYIIKVRGDVSMIGKEYKLYNKTVKPVIGMFVADATTIRYEVNSKGRIVKYLQTVRGNEVEFNPEDVIHIAYNKIPGCYSGLSPICAVLDDLRALRKLEEEIEILGFQYSIPLYLYKVGTDNHPAQQGEIDAVKMTVNSMPTYGIMCVPHTHHMESVTSDHDSVDIMGFVQHFKKRIYASLGVSPIAMGDSDTSNRSTARALDFIMQNTVKSYQQIMQNKIEQELINELLIEGKFNLTMVECIMHFPEIDLENQIKFETNEIQKFLNNLTTRSESRMAMDYDIAIDDKDTYMNLIQIPLAKSAAKVAETGAAKTNASLSRPKNQHGTSSGRPRDKKDSMSDEVSSLYDCMFVNNDMTSKINHDKFMEKITPKIKEYIKNQIDDTILEKKNETGTECTVDTNDVNTLIKHVLVGISYKLERLSADSMTDYKVGYTRSSIIDSIDITDKIRNIVDLEIAKKNNAEMIIIDADSCPIHENSIVSVLDIDASCIPPTTSKCRCKIRGNTKETYDNE